MEKNKVGVKIHTNSIGWGIDSIYKLDFEFGSPNIIIYERNKNYKLFGIRILYNKL